MVFISCENFIFYEYKNDFTTSNCQYTGMGKRPNEIEYNQLEGFVRQIIGWRVHARNLLKMPDYASMNFFNNQEKLPEWFWTGKPKCIV
jgi:deoxyribodipyrimidine photolyase-like uncharacterized protein